MVDPHSSRSIPGDACGTEGRVDCDVRGLDDAWRNLPSDACALESEDAERIGRCGVKMDPKKDLSKIDRGLGSDLYLRKMEVFEDGSF